MIKNAFERYAPFIQEYIYKKKWTDLREVQVEACEAIMDTNKHVIVASGTASGKTEAAFFPILTLLDQNPPQSVGIMYIGPLKALINDQFERLEELLGDSGIPVWPWHGDISQSVKKQALRTAQGVIQITPESLESLLMGHPGDAKRLFSDLRFVVIDEIHALMGEDRGLQVICLISRLEKMVGCRLRRIGLSATLNDYKPAMDFLAADSNIDVVAVGINGHKRTISLCAESFIIPEDEKEAIEAKEQYYDFLYDSCYGKKCLIFTNSRGKAEEVILNMKNIAKKRNERDIFYVHHGSISAVLRQEAEQALRDNAEPAVAAATLTLELGIDIGDLDMTIQVGAPYSCSSFVQRLGRSGRRTGKSQMMFVNVCGTTPKNLFDYVPWELIRSIAVIQLYLEEHWVEPFEPKRKPFSLLAHQTLSTLMIYGELSAAELARKVLLLPAFKDNISPDEYKELLRYMVQKDYLQRIDNGGIIIGLKGERIANHYSFYSVFQEEKTYHVMAQEGEVGTLTNCPAVEEVFVLAGKSWKVISIDENRMLIYVNRVKSAKVPSWHGSGGGIHTKVVQRMKKVLQEDKEYVYLRPNALKILRESRIYARENNLLESIIVPGGKHMFYICPWLGTKQIRTLVKLLSCGLKKALEIMSVSSTQHYLCVTTKLNIEEWIRRFKEYEYDFDDPDLVLPQKQTPLIDKYDAMVPTTLLRKAFLYNEMDLLSAVRLFDGEEQQNNSNT